jgi:hypothetical protein
MIDDAAQSQAIGASTKPGPCIPDERAIDAIAQLLASERPLSEILQCVKKPAADADDAAHSNHPPGRPNSETMPLAEPVAPTLAHAQVQESTGPLDPNRSAAVRLGLGTSDVQRSSLAVLIRGTSPQFAPQQTALVWLIPLAALAVVAVAGRSLNSAGVVPITAEAAPREINAAVQLGRDRPGLLGAEAVKSASTILPAEPDRTEGSPKLPDRAVPQLTSEQIKALLDRGDALVGNADLASARVPYEQAAAAGDSEAALRLGATYDPNFIAQAGIRNVRGEVTIAQYWYGRARDLKTSPTQLSSLSQPIEVARAFEPLPAETVPKPAIEAGVAVKARLQATDPAMPKLLPSTHGVRQRKLVAGAESVSITPKVTN